MRATDHVLLLASAPAVVPPAEAAAPLHVLGFAVNPTLLAALIAAAQVAVALLVAALLLRLVPLLERLVLRRATRRGAVFDESQADASFGPLVPEEKILAALQGVVARLKEREG